jgi:ABC-2 type transport system ATP-binding protein
MKKIIDIHKLDFHYKRQEKLLSDLSLQLRNGKIHGLLGKNGEGKSTLLKLVSGLLFPMKGEIKVLGFEPRLRNPKMLENIFLLPEEMLTSSLSIKAFETVYAPFYPNFSSSSFYKYLNDFTLDTKIQNIDELSYGQKKKFFIAFGLATNARLILMDEPTNGLDIPSKRQFRKMVAAAINEKCCILISTHQVLDLDNVLDNIIIIDGHKIIFNETSEKITQKLLFKISDKKETDKSIIYSEETSSGYSLVCENNTGEASKLDIELLFNAITHSKDRIQELLNQ